MHSCLSAGCHGPCSISALISSGVRGFSLKTKGSVGYYVAWCRVKLPSTTHFILSLLFCSAKSKKYVVLSSQFAKHTVTSHSSVCSCSLNVCDIITQNNYEHLHQNKKPYCIAIPHQFHHVHSISTCFSNTQSANHVYQTLSH